MKHVVAAVLISFCIAAGCFAKENTNPVGVQFSIGSGYTFYGDRGMKDLVSDMNSDDFSRIILGGDAGIFGVLTDNVHLIGGCDLMTDLFWKGGQHCYIFDYSFLAGLRVYPGLGGFSFSVLYALGRRSAVIDLDYRKSETVHSSWGNGFKLALEYDMKYGQTGIAPVFGAAWKHMPRGNDNADNTVSVYLRFMIL